MITIFEPQEGKKYFDLYPELRELDELKELRAKEAEFAWYMGNPTSPLVMGKYGSERNNVIRIGEALKLVYGKDPNKLLSEEMRQQYLAGEYPERIKVAIKRMARFDVTARERAKNMSENIFSNLENLIKFDEESFEIKDKEGNVTGIDWSAKKAYAELATKVSDNLPVLIRQLEEGFGVTKKNDKESGVSAIDNFHDR